MNLYDFLPYDDPIYCEIKRLSRNEHVDLKVLDSELIVTLNFLGIYEVSNGEIHESFRDMKDCYDFINEFLSETQTERGII